MNSSMILDQHIFTLEKQQEEYCTPAAAAAAIESMLKFCHILSMGGAAAGANRGVQGTGYNPIFCNYSVPFSYTLSYMVLVSFDVR